MGMAKPEYDVAPKEEVLGQTQAAARDKAVTRRGLTPELSSCVAQTAKDLAIGLDVPLPNDSLAPTTTHLAKTACRL